MKIKRVIISNPQNHVIFKGNPLSLPYKKESIKEKCIELFNDADPCIIHESYAIHQFSLALADILEGFQKKTFDISKIAPLLPFIDFSKYIDCILEIEVKS